MSSARDISSVKVVSFNALDPERRAALADLAVAPEQSEFGGDFKGSIAEIEAAPSDLHLGAVLSFGDAPVGLCLLKRPPFAPDWARDDAVTLHGLKIDRSVQGRGFGRVLMRGAIDLARTRWPAARRVQLMVDAGNAAALGLYRSFGMDDSGPVHTGRIGQEHRLEANIADLLATGQAPGTASVSPLPR